MTSKYKKNNFSTKNSSTSLTEVRDYVDKSARPNIDHLIKKILDERRQERKNVMTLGVVFFSIVSISYFFQN
mgnify:CR=1 FL=1|jgi:hypothetical protein|tara:strand:+ start:327 stop:542 length:216 start_codon:yes stop_codon:yes gene_type:complete